MEFTNRATKTYYGSFLKAIEKIKTIDIAAKAAAYKSQLSQLEVNLKNIKKLEPQLDVSELEIEYEKYKYVIDGIDSQKSLDKDEELQIKNFEFLYLMLNETKFNFDNIDEKVRTSTEAVERDLKIFKAKHPDYDTKVFDDKIIDFQNKFRAKLEATSNQNSSELQFKKDYLKVIHKPHFSIWTLYPDYQKPVELNVPLYQYIPEDLVAFEKILDDYKNGFDSFLSQNDMTEINKQFVSSTDLGSRMKDTGRLSNEANIVSSMIEDNLNKIDLKQVRDLQNSIQETLTKYHADNYFNTLALAHFWIGLSKLHPNQTEIMAIASEFQKLIDMYGSIENYKSKIRENAKKNAKKVFLPPAEKQDADLEALIKTAFEQKGWNETVLKIHILSHDWQLQRKDLVVGRVLDAAIASKKEDGDCMLYIATIRQEFAGDDNYSQAYLYSFNNTYIAEENIR